MGFRRPTIALTLRARAALAWGLIALVLSVGLSILAYQQTRQRLVDERVNSAVERAYLNARLVRSALRTTNPDLTAVLSSLESHAGSSVLARVSGEWFSGSVGVGPEALPASLTEAVADGAAGHQRVVVDDAPHVVVGVPIASADARYFELVAMDDIDRTLDGLADSLTVAAVVSVVAAGALGVYASRGVLRPLRRFATAAERVAEGDLDTRLDTVGDRDLRAIERAFNRMAVAVQERIDREARFSSDVSHELRAPLASMLSALYLARRDGADPDAAPRALEELEERVSTLNDLVEDLLEISRAEAGVARLVPEPVDPVRLAAAVLERMSRGDVPVETVGAVPAVVSLDKRRVGQMLQNLVENADRYGGGATRVEVAADDGIVRYAVEDDGPGVAEHERTYIFERFARGETASRARARGTGLGLSLVAEHAALHGGRVRLEDAPGGGARFVVELVDQVDEADAEPFDKEAR